MLELCAKFQLHCIHSSEDMGLKGLGAASMGCTAAAAPPKPIEVHNSATITAILVIYGAKFKI
jgi:hypothetical protein